MFTYTCSCIPVHGHESFQITVITVIVFRLLILKVGRGLLEDYEKLQ